MNTRKTNRPEFTLESLMNTEKPLRKTAELTWSREPTSNAPTAATRSLTVRLPVDLYGHLQALSEAGGGNVSKALTAVIQLHRNGAGGAENLDRLLTSFAEIKQRITEIEHRVEASSDELAVQVGRQGDAIDEISNTLGSLLEILRDGPRDDLAAPAAIGTSSLPVLAIPNRPTTTW